MEMSNISVENDLNSHSEHSQEETLLSLFSTFSKACTAEGRDNEALQWYQRWVGRQLERLPSSITNHMVSPSTAFTELIGIFEAGISLDAMATHLIDAELMLGENLDQRRTAARTFAFAIVGWLTMLYQPGFGTCPPQQLAIADLTDGYAGQAYMLFKQDMSRIKRPITEFLLGFGIMLPQENLCISIDQEDCHAFEKHTVVRPSQINADILLNLGQINFKWIDTLAPHLEFDKATNTLFLFRYPSFCLASLRGGGPLFCCASEENSSAQWASETEISQTLQEILLSYRLLFGQSKTSRKAFKSMKIFHGESPDPFLLQLCTTESTCLPRECQERELYRLSRDFPILRSRIAILSHHMAAIEPRGWRELWRDKRNSAGWVTFWAVMVLGGAGLFLSLVQVLLQIIQLVGTKDS